MLDTGIYTKFRVKLQFRDKVYGGLPKADELLDPYIKAKFGDDPEAALIVKEDVNPPSEDDLVEAKEKSMTGFKCDDVGCYIGDYAIKAGLKQWASLCGLTVKKRGTKQTVKETLFVKGLLPGENGNYQNTDRKVYLQPISTEPDGVDDHAGHVDTAQGKKSIIRASEYREKATLEYEVWVLSVRFAEREGTKNLTEGDLAMMLELGQEAGIGANRSLESGKFDVLEFERI